ncbi:MAG TPA: PAS domain S-box protein [Acidobacteriaceae bacterium]|nr:PAS domain S-box protein [Acidobacteriaceae bacterium]
MLLRLLTGPVADSLLMIVALADAGVLALGLRIKRSAAAEMWKDPASGEPHKALLDSSASAMAAIDLDGRLTYVNPAAERMLGYDADELIRRWGAAEIFAPGEAQRVLAELQKLSGTHRKTEASTEGALAACLECMRSLPPSTAPGIEVRLRRKDGSLFPVTLHVSALRNGAGSIAGLVAVAVDESSKVQREHAAVDWQARTNDLLESQADMTASLSPTGRFLKANTAWKRILGLDSNALLAMESFLDVFAPASRAQVAGLFRQALAGETIDRAPLRHHTPVGRPLELELTLTRRHEAHSSVPTVRCLLRDVTHQKRREQRLALQFALSQMAGESETTDSVTTRILEALCLSEGWDLAIQWDVDLRDDCLRFNTAWGAPGSAESLMSESVGTTFASGEELPGRAWKEGQPVWVSDLASQPSTARNRSAMRREMVSGWATPVRIGKKVVAVLEFYCRFPLREDHEAEAAVEAVAASLGQIEAQRRERQRNEELYRQQEILLDSVADGICGIDRDGVVSFMNPAAGRLLAADASSLIGIPVHDLLHGFAPAGSRCGENCSLRQAATRQMTSAGEENIYRSDGTAFPAEYVLTPLVDQGQLAGFVLSFRDISQRFALDRLKDEFISTVSHELRTPLTSIRGALGLLSSGVLNQGQGTEKAGNLLRIALSNSDRLVRLINDILDLERIQSGREPLAFRSVQLGDVVRQAIDGMQPVAESAGVQLIHDATQVEIAADPDRLLQVLTNLLSNAVKFSPPNSTVSVMLRPGVTGVTISVIDHGRGIPADKLEAIFGRFQQVDASDAREKGGTGLGLAICRTIVLQHAGRIWAERNPLRGSTFRVYLPYQPEPVKVPPSALDEDSVAPGFFQSSTAQEADSPVSNA